MPITPALVVNLPERVLCLDVLALYIRRIEPEDAGFLSILVHLPTVAGLVPRMRAFRRWRCAFLMAGEFTESLNGWESSPAAQEAFEVLDAKAARLRELVGVTTGNRLRPSMRPQPNERGDPVP